MLVSRQASIMTLPPINILGKAKQIQKFLPLMLEQTPHEQNYKFDLESFMIVKIFLFFWFNITKSFHCSFGVSTSVVFSVYIAIGIKLVLLTAWYDIIIAVDKGLNKRFDFFRLKSNRGSQKAKNNEFHMALKSHLVANGW